MPSTHHAEWLSLLDISGPFLSPPVLDRVFPQGLDAIDSDLAAKTRRAYEEWAEELQKPEPDPGIHDAWIRFVLTETLGYTPEVLVEGSGVPADLAFTTPELGETTRPDFVLWDPPSENPGNPRLLISTYPPDQDLGGTVAGSRWPASPAERTVQLCRATDVRLGLATNGERWMLVDAPKGDTSALASWYASLWSPEPLTLRAFVSLLGLRRFFGVAERDQLEAMLSESSSYQAEVTDQLGLQVRRAVEVLVEALDKADADTGRKLLADVPPERLYEAALTVMMRLVFLFTAEERDLLLLGDPTYDEFYAVSTLRAQLREAADQVGEEVLERRQDAWSRLLATFRAIYGGIHHESLEIVPYGSSLFDPDRFPFLEGRPTSSTWHDTEASPMPIDNRTVLLLLESLQLLDLGKKHGARRLSFRALDIEQIGHVYETLLDHTAVRAAEPMLSLQGNQGREPEIPVSKLHDLMLEDTDDKLVGFLKAELKKGVSPIRKALQKRPDPDVAARLLAACGGDKLLLAKIVPFHDLIRQDPWGDPVVIREGAVFVTVGEDRRSTGTHYTPRALTEEIVQYALEPVVYRGPADGKDRDQWELKPPAEILELKVCDPAMGSGAFLVQACRYLSERLVESWDQIDHDSPIDPEGNPAKPDDAIPTDQDNQLVLARRLVADRCLYGVDVNPLAVEMAKLSMWLITLAKDTPFSFLDHSLKCGDSLLGLTAIEHIRRFDPDSSAGDNKARSFFDPSSAIAEALDQSLRARQDLSAFLVADAFDSEKKLRLHREAFRAGAVVRLVADLVVAAAVPQEGDTKASIKSRMRGFAEAAGEFLRTSDPAVARNLKRLTHEHLNSGLPSGKAERRPFHWPLEFPEVFSRDLRGFDAVVGNPPFRGGSIFARDLGVDYRDYIVRVLGGGVIGRVDLVAYFFNRAHELLCDSGTLALIGTKSISEGHTRQVALALPIDNGGRIVRAVPSRPWPGNPGLLVAIVWMSKSERRDRIYCDGQEVQSINTYLTADSPALDDPVRLPALRGAIFRGVEIRGSGFVLDPDEVAEIVRRAPHEREVIRGYMNGIDLYGSRALEPRRYVIDFGTMSSREAHRYENCFRIVTERVKPERELITGQIHEADYWKHWDKRLRNFKAVEDYERLIVKAKDSGTWAWTSLPNHRFLIGTKVFIVKSDDWAALAILQSFVHFVWALRHASSIGAGMAYTPTRVFETFPFPKLGPGLRGAGQQFDQARIEIMQRHGFGLTDVHNAIDDPQENMNDIQRLRQLLAELNEATIVAFGWADLAPLRHDFVETWLGPRWMPPRDIGLAVEERLIRLNEAAGGGRWTSPFGTGASQKRGAGSGQLFET